MLDHESPQFVHDCRGCTFLGTYKQDDLYVCKQGTLGYTVIARHSDSPGDYVSGMIFAHINPALGEAKRRAQKLGILK